MPVKCNDICTQNEGQLYESFIAGDIIFLYSFIIHFGHKFPKQKTKKKTPWPCARPQMSQCEKANER